jgi:hypothetical protein
MTADAHNERDCHVVYDPIASGAMPWLIEEFGRIQARYDATPSAPTSVTDTENASHDE